MDTLSHMLCKAFSTLLSLCFITGHLHAASVTYQYDALGRLTFVEDATNGNRDYDYDKAGNRLLVSSNTANDTTANPPSASVPATPTGLTVRGPFSPTGDGYNFSWNAVPGATSYTYQFTDGRTYTTTKTVADSPGPRPRWVYASNAVGSSGIANFP